MAPGREKRGTVALGGFRVVKNVNSRILTPLDHPVTIFHVRFWRVMALNSASGIPGYDILFPVLDGLWQDSPRLYDISWPVLAVYGSEIVKNVELSHSDASGSWKT